LKEKLLLAAASHFFFHFFAQLLTLFSALNAEAVFRAVEGCDFNAVANDFTILAFHFQIPPISVIQYVSIFNYLNVSVTR
jgi:hypothetical protein